MLKGSLKNKKIGYYLARNKVQVLFATCLILIAFIACTDDRDKYYDRPEWLQPPVYEVLKNKGSFTQYLKCVDRTMYAAPLKASGQFTVLAPNDDAFADYLQKKNLNTVDELPDSSVNQIVSYSLLYNKYTVDRLTDVLSNGWDTLSSIKKKTTYYETLHLETYQNNSIWVYDMPSFAVGDNNYKYVPFYMEKVFESNRTKSQADADYNMFYHTTYTGHNVQHASIIDSDIYAENGIIHVIDQVLEPMSSLENILEKLPDFTLFKSLVEKENSTGEKYFINYTYSKAATDYFQQSFPERGIGEVYLKSYTDLAYGMNFERFGKSIADAEKGGHTLFAPDNLAITQFYEDKLKEFYPDGIESLPKDVIAYFVNAQMVEDQVWPGDYKGSINSQGEYLNGKGNYGDEFNPSHYSHILPASNGLFYGGNTYIRSRYFETVFSEILLNPAYSLLNYAFKEYFAGSLDEVLMQCVLNGYSQENYTVLLPDDELLEAEGFKWSWIAGSKKYGFENTYASNSMGNFDAALRLQRLIRSHIFRRVKNDEINSEITEFITDPDFATAYGGYSYAVNEYGDMIRFKDGKIQMIGNFDENDWVTATPYKTFLNGQVFKIDQLLQYSPRNKYPNQPEGYTQSDLWSYVIQMSSGLQNPNVAVFKNFMNACLRGDGSNELAGLSADAVHTFFMPSNAAMNKAIANGDLPPLVDVTADVVARQKATAFILHHIVKGKVFVDDGLSYIMPNKEKLTEEIWPTVYKDIVDNTYLAIQKDETGKLMISTQSKISGKEYSKILKSATVTRGLKRSNYFAPRAVLHEINDYLIYEKPDDEQ